MELLCLCVDSPGKGRWYVYECPLWCTTKNTYVIHYRPLYVYVYFCHVNNWKEKTAIFLLEIKKKKTPIRPIKLLTVSFKSSTSNRNLDGISIGLHGSYQHIDFMEIIFKSIIVPFKRNKNIRETLRNSKHHTQNSIGASNVYRQKTIQVDENLIIIQQHVSSEFHQKFQENHYEFFSGCLFCWFLLDIVKNLCGFAQMKN